jgi:hypothetical protein
MWGNDFEKVWQRCVTEAETYPAPLRGPFVADAKL